MDLLEHQDTMAKWAKLIALTNAIQRAIEAGEWVQRDTGNWHRKYTVEQALEVQHLENQRRTLRATMPLRVVSERV